MLLLLVFVAAFGTAALVTWYVLVPREDPVSRRVLAGAAPPGARERRLEAGLRRRLLAPLAVRAGRRVSSFLPNNLVRKVDQLLLMANEPWSLAGFLATWTILALGGGALFVYVLLVGAIAPLQSVGVGILVIGFPLLVPYAVLRRRARTRQRAIARALPDALDLLTTAVEAGLAVDGAFALVAEKTSGPLSETFALYLRQVGFGRSRREALNHVAARTGVPDLLTLAAAINQGEELGTTVGDVLRVQAQELRTLRRQRAQEAAQRAPVLMTIPLALCFLPAMGAVVVVPSILNLVQYFSDFGGG